MKKLLILLFFLLLSVPVAAQSVQQSPVFVTPGHAAFWVTNGVIGDAGSAQNPSLTGIGTIGQGSTICANSGVNTGPYNQLCFGVNQASAAQFVLQNFGGASAQTLQFVINGTTYQFPFTTNGALGPPSTVIGHAVCWNNITGTLLSDCGAPPVLTSVPNTFTAAQTFTNSDFLLLGSSTGATTFTSANASATNYTVTFPAATGNLTYVVGSLTSTHCLQASGTAGGIADSGVVCGAIGGASTNVQFNSSGVLAGDSGFTYAGNGQVTHALGAISTNLKALTITGTWNAIGTTFDAPLFMNITNTASALGSALFDFQVGGVTAVNAKNTTNNNFSLQVNANPFGVPGDVLIQGTSDGFQYSNLELDDNLGGSGGGGVQWDFSFRTANHAFLFFTCNNGTCSSIQRLDATVVVSMPSDGVMGFGNSTHTGGTWTTDTGISRGAAATLDVGNGTAADVSGTIVAAHATLNALANTATTSAVCYNVGTGVLTYDGTIGTCNTSTMRVKHDIAPLQINALAGIMTMRPVSFYYNDSQHTHGQQLGLIAEDLAAIDPRLVSYDEQGQPNSIRFLGPLHAYEIGAIQELAQRLAAIERKLHR